MNRNSFTYSFSAFSLAFVFFRNSCEFIMLCVGVCINSMAVTLNLYLAFQLMAVTCQSLGLHVKCNVETVMLVSNFDSGHGA